MRAPSPFENRRGWQGSKGKGPRRGQIHQRLPFFRSTRVPTACLSLWPANSENQLPTFETRPLLNWILRAGGLTTSPGWPATLSYYNHYFPFLHFRRTKSLSLSFLSARTMQICQLEIFISSDRNSLRLNLFFFSPLFYNKNTITEE